MTEPDRPSCCRDAAATLLRLPRPRKDPSQCHRPRKTFCAYPLAHRAQTTQSNPSNCYHSFRRVQESRNGIREVVDTAKHREETAMKLGVRQQNLIKPASNQRNGRRQECRATTIVRQLCRSNVYPTKVLKRDRFTKHFSQASQSRKCV